MKWVLATGTVARVGRTVISSGLGPRAEAKGQCVRIDDFGAWIEFNSMEGMVWADLGGCISSDAGGATKPDAGNPPTRS